MCVNLFRCKKKNKNKNQGSLTLISLRTYMCLYSSLSDHDSKRPTLLNLGNATLSQIDLEIDFLFLSLIYINSLSIHTVF